MNRHGAKPASPPALRPDSLEEATARGMADAEAGRVVPHAKVKEWLAKLARGERAPRPR